MRDIIWKIYSAMDFYSLSGEKLFLKWMFLRGQASVHHE